MPRVNRPLARHRRFSVIIAVPLLAFVALFAVLLISSLNSDNAVPSAQQGLPAPPVVVTALPNRATFTDADLRTGGVKLVNYWASWCGPCRVEHPHLMALANEGVAIYGVNYKDNAERANDFLDKLGDPFRGVGQDSNGRMALDWGLFGVPETYILDARGVVVLRFAGPITERVLHETIRPVLRQHLGGEEE